MRVNGVIGLLVVVLAAGCSAPVEKIKQPLLVEDAWLRAPPPGLDKTAGYFRLTNHSGKALSIVGASSDQIRAIEMHTTIKDGDMMRMRRLKTIPIPPDETIVFEPGGKHLMIFGLRTTENVNISLAFDDGSTVTAPFERR